ncbi:MAG: gliding motility-associated C-terminal domain-containing protein, partial [Bacteroidia bacterium]|nr:gliding motility-associated C-terminal domain-containing protein [Bacteroidia bacterium]
GTDVNNCSNSLTINVPDLNSEINANINALSGTEINCNNLEIALQADVNGNIDNLIFSWILDGTQISDQTELIIQDAGQVELFIEDTISLCTYSETLIVEEIEDSLSNINFLIVDPICFGEVGSIKFENISGSIDFDVFLNGNLVLNESDLENLIPGQYTLELIDENGCQRDTSFEISEGRQLVIDLGDDITAVYGEEIEIEGMVNIPANEIIDFNWNIADSLNCNNCLNPTLNAYKNEEIILEITDEFGCKALDTLSLTIDNEVNYFVPNIFSPNNDGNNDFLSLYLSDGKTKVFDFRILDRWGNLVLFRPEISEENDFLIWDGYSNGIAVVQGVYVYVAKLLLIDGTETLITGNITVVR